MKKKSPNINYNISSCLNSENNKISISKYINLKRIISFVFNKFEDNK